MDGNQAWVVWQNTDLTEGRGHEVPYAVCEIEATALRIAKGKNVQGSDCRIEAVPLIKQGGMWYGPVRVLPPNPGDTKVQASLDAWRSAVQKARAAGLSEEEIAAIAGKIT